MRLSIVSLLFFAVAIRADELANKIRAITDAPEYKPARWGILVVDAKTGGTVYEANADKLFLPASVTKLFTCATALDEFGPDFRFTTPVFRRGEVKDGVLDGDLILVASGDLTFGGRRGKSSRVEFTDSDHTYANSGLMDAKLTDTDPLHALNDLARQVAMRISKVNGEIMIDDRLFARTRSSGSGPDVVCPLLVNDNVIDVIITPGAKEGDPANVKMRPETAYFQMDADVQTGKDKELPSITMEITGATNFMVRGRVPAKGDPVVRIMPVDEPVLWARALFIDALKRNGVKVATSLHRLRRYDLPSREAAGLVKIAEYHSEPFADVLKVTMKVSHNLYASTLPVLVGLRHGDGTPKGGLHRQAKLLKSLGVDPLMVSFASGAGGGSADSTTPRATVSLLRAMAKQPAASDYFDALPILGVDGTLADVVDKASPAKGKIRAKTGTLAWVDSQNDRLMLRSKALAGELQTAKGTKLYFAMFLNDFPIPKGGSASDQGKVLGKICEVIHKHGP